MNLPATDRPLLFEPIQLRGVAAKNRIMMSPMCQYSAADGVPNEWHYIHLSTRAVGGAGIVMTEATAIEPIGRISPWDTGLYTDEQEGAFARIAERIGEYGSIPGIQLAHAGRKASHMRPWEERRALAIGEGGWDVIAPSAIPWEPGDVVPRAMTTTDIADVVEKWQIAARRALRAGFRVLEIHAAHGYLLHEFLSPLSNKRTDEYGGSLEGRARLLVEVVGAVRAVWPDDLPLFVRLSATDWVEGGWTVDESVAATRLVQGIGVDVIDCSSGGSAPEQAIDRFPGYQVPFAARIREETGIMTAAVGLLVDPFHVEEVLRSGEADIAVMGRMMLWDPYWPHHAAAALGIEPALPIQYERSGIHARLHRARGAAYPNEAPARSR